MSTATIEDTYTPHASSTTALKEARISLVEAQEALKAVDLRSLKGQLRDDVRTARDAVNCALKHK